MSSTQISWPTRRHIAQDRWYKEDLPEYKHNYDEKHGINAADSTPRSTPYPTPSADSINTPFTRVDKSPAAVGTSHAPLVAIKHDGSETDEQSEKKTIEIDTEKGHGLVYVGWLARSLRFLGAK